jgi:hypothetical protein
MKKILVTTIAFCFFLITHAQTEKSDWLVGGGLQFNTSQSNSEFVFNPNVGWFVANNFAIGAQFFLSHSKLGNFKTTSYGAGPFARYYFLKKNVRPFVLVSGDAETGKIKFSSGSTTENAFNYFLGGGTAFFINQNVALEGIIGYKHSAVKNESGAGGLNFSFGFQVYINRNQAESVRSTFQKQ